MRIKVPCAVCANVADRKQYEFKLFDGELDDAGYVHVSCDKGHKSIVIYDSRRYEILLQSATNALLDGYTNEAISTYGTALERCYEFYIRVVLRSHGIEPQQVEEAWKEVAAQSERQFGAFHFLWLLEHGEVLNLDPKIPKIRNRVLHRGKIVTMKEALEFGELVFSRIKAIEESLSNNERDLEAEQKHEVEAQKQRIPAGLEHFVLKVSSVKIDPATNEVVGFPDTFKEYVAAIIKARNRVASHERMA